MRGRKGPAGDSRGSRDKAVANEPAALQSTQKSGTEQPASFPAAHDICHAPLTHPQGFQIPTGTIRFITAS